MILAYASVVGGTLLSPLHLCLVMTKDYFRADWKGIFGFLWIPVAFILMVGLLMALVLKGPAHVILGENHGKNDVEGLGIDRVPLLNVDVSRMSSRCGG